MHDDGPWQPQNDPAHASVQAGGEPLPLTSSVVHRLLADQQAAHNPATGSSAAAAMPLGTREPAWALRLDLLSTSAGTFTPAAGGTPTDQACPPPQWSLTREAACGHGGADGPELVHGGLLALGGQPAAAAALPDTSSSGAASDGVAQPQQHGGASGLGTSRGGSSLLIKNLPPDADDLYLYRLCSPYGAVLSCSVLPKLHAGQYRGTVAFHDADRAARAAQWLHGMRTGHDHEQLHVTLQTSHAARAAPAAASPATIVTPGGAPSWGPLPTSLPLQENGGRDVGGAASWDAALPGRVASGRMGDGAAAAAAAAAQISSTLLQAQMAAEVALGAAGGQMPALDSPCRRSYLG